MLLLSILEATLARYSSHTHFRYSAHELILSAKTYALDLHSEELQATIGFFTRNASSHKTDWILTYCCPLCLAFFYTQAFSQHNVLKVEGSRFRLLQSSIATACIGSAILRFFFQLVLISWMVTLTSCLIWQKISFIFPPNGYGYVYAWTTLENIATLLWKL